MRSACAVLLLWASGASAQMLSDRAPPEGRFVHRNLIAARVNPLGLGWEGRFAYRQRLYASNAIALRDNFVSVGLAPALTPTYGRLGPVVEVQPATFLGLWVGLDWMQYFGILSHLQSFPRASSDFSEGRIRALVALPETDRLHPYAAGGTMFTFGANVNLRFGRVVVRDAFKAFMPDFRLRPGDSVMYEQLSDLLLGNRSFTLTNDLDLLLELPRGVYAGLRYSAGVPLYGRGQGGADNDTHRLGPFLVWRVFDRDGAAFNQPTFALVVNWYAKHRYKTGAETPAALPYLAIAFQTNGDLVPLPPAPPP